MASLHKSWWIAALVVALLVAGGFYCGMTSQKREVDAEELATGATHPVSFGGTLTDIDRDAKIITVALKWVEAPRFEMKEVRTGDYSEISDEACLEVIEALSVGDQIKGYFWSYDYAKDPVPLTEICLDDGSQG